MNKVGFLGLLEINIFLKNFWIITYINHEKAASIGMKYFSLSLSNCVMESKLACLRKVYQFEMSVHGVCFSSIFSGRWSSFA